MHTLIEPFQYAFMVHGLIAAVLVGITCALLGVYVVLRQMAFVGDAMAHTALPGLVVAHLRGWNLFLGALVADLITAVGIGALSHRAAVREDTAIGVVFTGMFALGVLILSLAGSSFRDLTHMLFGDILGVTNLDLVLMTAVGLGVVIVLTLLHKELELSSLDPDYAQTIGLRTAILRYVLLILLALTVVCGIQVVGVILTSALLVTPAATASLLTRRLSSMMALACVIGVGSCISGLYLSYFRGWPSGATIVVVCTGIFIVVHLVSRLTRRRAARR